MAGMNLGYLGQAAQTLFPTVAQQSNLNGQAAMRYNILATGQQQQQALQQRRKPNGLAMGAASSLGLGL